MARVAAFLWACAVALLHSAPAASETIFITGGTVVNADAMFEADVLIEGDKIAAVGKGLKAPTGARVLDASGRYVMPGGIDPHTHLDMPFMGTSTADDYFSGQAAGLAGGTTHVIDFALPVDHNLRAGYDTWMAKARRGCADYSLHMAVTRWSGDVAADMEWLVTHGGVNSFKFFMAYKGALMVRDDELLAGLSHCASLQALPMVHAENGDGVAAMQEVVATVWGVTGPEGHALSRPSGLEAEATGRALALAGLAGVPLYVVHVMAAGAMEAIRRAREQGQRVVGEPVVSGLALEESVLWDRNWTRAAAAVMSPPIRSAADRDALRRGLAEGVLQLVGTDHAVFNSSQKAAGRHDFRRIPNGVNGIEERMHVVWHTMVATTRLLNASDFVRVTSTQAARTFNLYPRKGLVAAGSDADVIIFDPAQRHVISASRHHSASDVNVYEGMEVMGRVVSTISRGRLAWHDGKLLVGPHTSRFVPTPPGGPLYEGLQEEREAARHSVGPFGSRNVPYGPTPVLRTDDDARLSNQATVSKDEL